MSIKHLRARIFVAVLSLAGWSATVTAQDDFDLSIPGEEAEVTVPGGAGEDAPAQSASSGEVNLLEMIQAGGWSMWILGAFSFGVIGLLVCCLMDLILVQRKLLPGAEPTPACDRSRTRKGRAGRPRPVHALASANFG